MTITVTPHPRYAASPHLVTKAAGAILREAECAYDVDHGLQSFRLDIGLLPACVQVSGNRTMKETLPVPVGQSVKLLVMFGGTGHSNTLPGVEPDNDYRDQGLM